MTQPKQLISSLFLWIFLLISHFSFSQKKSYPQNYFRSPVNFPITLAGNFAELRNNHFHSGIDIRTFTIGKKVYAIADGYISRIKISPSGYGKAIYVDHPNGYTSVYGHLNRYNKKLNDFARRTQYQKKSFGIDIRFKKGQFPVKKGEIIAFSGNSGFSGGPHLHFEIRDTKSEHPINPQLFGFKIKDTRPPKIFNLYIYPQDSASHVNGKNSRQRFSVIYYDNAYHLKGDPKIYLHGNIGFSLQTNDYYDNTWGKCGIYKMRMKINDSLITQYTFNEFSFKESKYINSHMDFGLNVNNSKKVHKTFQESNNKLSVYESMKNKGIYYFESGKKYKIDFATYDMKGNKAFLRVYAKGGKIKSFPTKKFAQKMNFDVENQFTTENVEIKLPKDALYTNIKFEYHKKNDSTFLSDIHQIHKKTVALHKYYTIGIKPRKEQNQNIDKLLIVRKGKKGKLINANGILINGWMKTKTRYFGDFAIAMDTIPPFVKARTNFKLKSLAGQKRLAFTIKDQLAGIKSYRGTIDGKWVLFEYDAKNDLLFYSFDKNRLPSKRKHKLELVITDKVGNQKIIQKNFFW